MFHHSPAAHCESRGRTPVITASTNPGIPVVALNDTNHWRKSERHETLTHAPHGIARRQEITIATRIEEHWKRFLTPQFQALIAYRVQRIRLSFPPTARYSITATPADKLQRSGKLLPISSPKHLDLAVAAANTHTAYA